MDFKISYDQLKALLSVFYNSQYNQALPFINMLHALKEDETGLSLREKIDLEIALANQPKETEENLPTEDING